MTRPTWTPNIYKHGRLKTRAEMDKDLLIHKAAMKVLHAKNSSKTEKIKRGSALIQK